MGRPMALNLVRAGYPLVVHNRTRAKVDEFVQAFLERPPLPLIRTKRAINKRLIEQMNLTLDYSWLAELTLPSQ